jgi:hypothetical protein
MSMKGENNFNIEALKEGNIEFPIAKVNIWTHWVHKKSINLLGSWDQAFWNLQAMFWIENDAIT